MQTTGINDYRLPIHQRSACDIGVKAGEHWKFDNPRPEIATEFLLKIVAHRICHHYNDTGLLNCQSLLLVVDERTKEIIMHAKFFRDHAMNIHRLSDEWHMQ